MMVTPWPWCGEATRLDRMTDEEKQAARDRILAEREAREQARRTSRDGDEKK
ncbi:hypothetical protein [Marinitenerispora sediminis]|uniref:hypothetical protein n=1 Tax=Marinitenerispora sediminis TaxID=1931232 RepID=UPI001314CE9E|nr:hypothetical protein [Marinitenerispora sediminis]